MLTGLTLILHLKTFWSHRAHIEPYTSGLEFEELPDFTGDRQDQRQHFVSYVLKEKPVLNESGVSYHYSNAGYSVAATMLEKVSNRSWEQLVDQVMNKTLKLNIKLGWPNKISEDEPWGHWLEDGKLVGVPANTTYNLNLAEPAGDISINLPDYEKYVQLNLQGFSWPNKLSNT